jgi:predicted O-methyltransferase YrrM
MIKCDIFDIESDLKKDLNSQTISGKLLLDRFCVIEESSRKTAAYLDHKYAPFYYYLGKYIQPENVMEIGFNLGLLTASFFRSCKTANKFLGFKENSSDYIPVRLGKRNIRLVFKKEINFYVGNLYDQEMEKLFSSENWDLIFLNEETVYDKHLEYLDFVWDRLNEHGLIVSEYITRHTPAKEALFAFCESKNRKPLLFSTRYGTGILQK